MKKFSLPAVCLLTSMIFFSGCTRTNAPADPTPSQPRTQQASSQAQTGEPAGSGAAPLAIDGTFEGRSDGYGGEIVVSVTLEKGVILSIESDFSLETAGIGQVAGPQMIEKIIDSQSIAADTISGATVTTEAVRNAAGNALKSAGADLSAYENPVAKKEETVELTADVVVVGTGGAGTAAALVAAKAGKKVIVLEKNPFVGGNTKLSHGFFAVGTKWQREKGIDVNVDEAVRRLLEFNNYLSNGPLTRAIVENSAETVEWIDSLGMHVQVQEGTTQFAHAGDDYKAQSYHVYENTEEGFARLYEKLEALGAELYLGTTMDSILFENGTVKGVTAKGTDGSVLKIYADATMIATGGYGANEEIVRAVTQNAKLNSLGVPNQGEGLTAMTEIGAVDIDSTPLLHAAQLAESEVSSAGTGEHLAGFSMSPITQLLMSPLLWVDPSGSRFVNEDVVYDTAFWANAAYAVGGQYFFVVDSKTLAAYTEGSKMLISKAGPGANMDPGDFIDLAEQAVQNKTAFKGATIEELAKNAGMTEEDLAASVARYNRMIENKADTDYAKSPESLLYPVTEGPFYAFDCRAVFLGTIGGVRVNERLEVLDAELRAIPGLYTGGTNAGGYYNGRGYPPYEGLASGFTWTSGKIAGESIVKFLQER